MHYANLFLDGFQILLNLTIIVSILIVNRGTIRRSEDRWFLALCSNLTILCFLHLLLVLLNGSLIGVLSYLGNLIGSIIYALGFLSSIFYARYCESLYQKKNVDAHRLFRILYLAASFFLLLDLLNFWNGMYFSFQEGAYTRGPLFELNQLFALLIACFLFLINWIYRKKMGLIHFHAFLCYFLLPVVAIILQIFFPKIMLLYPAMSLSVLIIYSMSYTEMRREAEEILQKSKVDLMLAQIRPHFLYNSLTAIYGLCEKDPKTAKHAILDFSHYLRHNLDATELRAPIPFREELQHIQAYLRLEQLRYDNLIVVYQINCQDFLLPPLTIQPLVENSIKHGISKKEDGGTVTLMTEETEKAYVIRVKDTGVGFQDPLPDDPKNVHLGIKNVRLRLETLSQGTLSITSIPEVGTVAEVHLPKRKQEST